MLLMQRAPYRSSKQRASFFVRGSLCLLILMFFTQCAHPPIKNKNKAMRKVSVDKIIFDDLPLDSFRKGLSDLLLHFKKTERENSFIQFGPEKILISDYINSLEQLQKHLSQTSDQESVFSYIKNNFNFYEVYGKKNWGEVFITSYFEPVIQGTRRPTKKMNFPLYKIPDDFVFIEKKAFFEVSPERQVLQNECLLQTRKAHFSGRLVELEDKKKQIVPYYTREEIVRDKKLKNQSLEIAWVDPIDGFFLQIQGSGQIQVGNEIIRVGYAAQNGHSYVPIGKFLFDVIPKEEMSLQAIESYLRALSEDKRDELLNKNPSYVFFRLLESDPITTFGTETIEGRTIATDPLFFSKGAIGYLEFEKPVFSEALQDKPENWVKTSRLVFDQDTGGAIRGPDRVDLFWGSGNVAKQHAGVIKNWGRLYYLVPVIDN